LVLAQQDLALYDIAYSRLRLGISPSQNVMTITNDSNNNRTQIQPDEMIEVQREENQQIKISNSICNSSTKMAFHNTFVHRIQVYYSVHRSP
jgi:hypothetical protein